VKKNKMIQLDFVIDKLTDSIQNTISGDSFQTEISRLTRADLKNVTAKSGWNFNWKKELENNKREVFKLTITNNPNIIQGLLSFTIKPDYLYMDLLESAPFNLGHKKLYEGVPGNLVAYACKVFFKTALKASFLLQLKPNLLNITKKL
jgi:hypothetical protein